MRSNRIERSQISHGSPDGGADFAEGPRSSPLARIGARLGRYAVGAWENPDWTLIFTLGRIVFIRRALRDISRYTAPEAPPASLFFPAIPMDQAAEALRTDGIYCGLQLPEACRSEIVSFATSHPCYGGFNRAFAFLPDEHAAAERRYDRRFLVASYLADIEDCPAVTALRSDPALTSLAAAYLHADPRPISTRLWWSFRSPGASDDEMRHAAQNRFHSDINDWRSLKFFFYLTDVDESSGPHIFVRGTHWSRALKHQLAIFTGRTRDDIVETYGHDRLMTICGASGFGFAEDPFAFHTGTTVRCGRRLMLQIEYGVSHVSPRRFYGA